MDNKKIADVLYNIISETPATQELYPLLCALAKVADNLNADSALANNQTGE